MLYGRDYISSSSQSHIVHSDCRMIALAAPRFKWPHLTSSRLISPRLAWPGRGLCYVSTRQQLKILLDWHCNGKRAEGLGQWTCHTLMLDIDANLKVTCIIGCLVWFLAIFFCGWASNATDSCAAGDFSLVCCCCCCCYLVSHKYTAGQWVCG